MDQDCIDACMSPWALGGGSDAASLQMQRKMLSTIVFLSATSVA
jgi:hypothetical protein